MDVVQPIVNADNRPEIEKFTSCLNNWKQWSWTLSPGPPPMRLNYLPESDSGVSFHQLLTPNNKQKIIIIEVCITSPYQQSHNCNDYNGYLTIPFNRISLQNRTPPEPAVEQSSKSLSSGVRPGFKFQPSIFTPCMTWPNDFTSLCVSFINCK